MKIQKKKLDDFEVLTLVILKISALKNGEMELNQWIQIRPLKSVASTHYNAIQFDLFGKTFIFQIFNIHLQGPLTNPPFQIKCFYSQERVGMGRVFIVLENPVHAFFFPQIISLLGNHKVCPSPSVGLSVCGDN